MHLRYLIVSLGDLLQAYLVYCKQPPLPLETKKQPPSVDLTGCSIDRLPGTVLARDNGITVVGMSATRSTELECRFVCCTPYAVVVVAGDNGQPPGICGGYQRPCSVSWAAEASRVDGEAGWRRTCRSPMHAESSVLGPAWCDVNGNCALLLSV